MTFDVLIAVSISTMVFFEVHFIQTTATRTNRFAYHSVSETVICTNCRNVFTSRVFH